MTDEWLDVKEVAARVCCTSGNVWAKVKRDADFPKPYKLGTRTVRWKEKEVEAYVESNRLNAQNVQSLPKAL